MNARHASTAVLWLVFVLLIGLGSARLGPFVWSRIFPGIENSPQLLEQATAEEGSLELEARTPERAAEALHRVLANWGVGNALEPDLIYLPEDRRPGELQATLRALPALSALEVYVTRVDDLLFRLRIFDGATLLLSRDVFPYLPERPVVSGINPPEVSALVLLSEQESGAIDRLCAWRAPLAIGVPPFAAHAVGSIRLASRCSKGVLLVLDVEDDISEQLASAPEASGVVLLSDLEEDQDLNSLLAPLRQAEVFLLDGRPSGSLPNIEKPARALGLRYLRWAGTIGKAGDLVLARNLSVRRGYGVVAASPDDEGLELLESFLEVARDDGYNLMFPVEIARIHGKGPPVER
ncbi:MAG: hypothetical protein CMP23_13685 [Rickettsiales bacterium]|nr:hypothetical protein [Rickettsiales bacterium]|tara:strand:+ start:2018 stop:3070 length:1053 start_codon:yes stop_codon:yes gene_type:complete